MEIMPFFLEKEVYSPGKFIKKFIKNLDKI